MDIKFKMMGKIATDTIFQVKGFIDLVAERYRKFVSDYKERSALFRQKLYDKIKGEMMEFIDDTVIFLKQFDIINKMVNLYKLLEAWVEENNILTKIQRKFLEFKRCDML